MKFLVRWVALGVMRWPLGDAVETGVTGEGEECVREAKCHLNLIVKLFAKLIHPFREVKHEQHPNAPYETHDGELPAVVEPFKNWRHYLEHGSRSLPIIPPAVHGYKELELPSGLLGLIALLIPLPHRLSANTSSSLSLTPLHQVLIRGTHVFPLLLLFQDTIRQELAAAWQGCQGNFASSRSVLRARDY